MPLTVCPRCELWNTSDMRGTICRIMSLARPEAGTFLALGRSAGLGAQDFNNPDLWTELRNPDQFNIDLQARYNLGSALKLKEQKLDLVVLMVNMLSSAAASALTETPKAKNNNYGYATGFGHYAPFQAELLIRYRN